MDLLRREQNSDKSTANSSAPTLKLFPGRKPRAITQRRRVCTEKIIETILKLRFVDQCTVTSLVKGLNKAKSAISKIINKYEASFMPVIHRYYLVPKISQERLDRFKQLQKETLSK
jgi:hypothetical protein